MPTRNRSAPRPGNLYPDVDVVAELLKHPVPPCKQFPDGIPGTLTINGKVYSIVLLIEKRPGDLPEVLGYRLLTGSGDVHDLPWDLNVGGCDCGDAVFRRRPQGCRHRRALLRLRELEILA